MSIDEKEGQKEDIEAAIRDLLEKPGRINQELKVFSVGFGGFMGLLKKMRKEGVSGGVIPKEVEENGLDASDLDGITETLQSEKIGLHSGIKSPFIPVMELEGQQVGITLKPVPSADTAGTIDDDLKIMSSALKYLHSSATRLKRFPHVYEYIKAFALCYAPEAKPSVDRNRLADFFNSIPFKLSDGPDERAYREVFRSGKTQTILHAMMKVENVTEEGFRNWLETFQPEKHQGAWYRRLQVLVAEKFEENIPQFKKEFLDAVADKSPRYTAGQMEAAPLPLKTAIPQQTAEIQSPALENNRAEIKEQVASATTGKMTPAGKSEETGVVVGKIINVGKTTPPPPDVDAEAEKTALMEKEALVIIKKLGATLSTYLGSDNLTFGFFSALCELVFGDNIQWVKGSKVDWKLLLSAGYVTPFAKLNRGKDEDLCFVNELFSVRRDLEAQGLRTKEIRKFFIRKLPANIKKHE